MTFILGGITLTSAFDLNFGNKHVPLGDKKLAEFRTNLADLKLIIIDEISLVKADMLYQIHRRLCEIFPDCAKFPFAKRSVIVVGDLLQVNYILLNIIIEFVLIIIMESISDQTSKGSLHLSTTKE